MLLNMNQTILMFKQESILFTAFYFFTKAIDYF